MMETYEHKINSLEDLTNLVDRSMLFNSLKIARILKSETTLYKALRKAGIRSKFCVKHTSRSVFNIQKKTR